MIRSFYIAGTGMITQRNKQDVVINNITNADTVGYKQDQMLTRSFKDMLLSRVNDAYRSGEGVGPQNTGVHVDDISINFSQGNLEPTYEQTDLAIQGDGFFTVRTPQGIQYTRAGNFQVDANGTLLTQDGSYVLGEGGQPLNVGTGAFTVKPDGTIQVNGQNAGRLQIVTFQDLTVLRKAGNNNFVPYNGEQPTAMQNPSVLQGAVEDSNVDVGTAVADMMMTQRVYESSARILTMTDESLSLTVGIGKF